MRRFILLLLFAALGALTAPAHSQSRVYSQPELDALLAPIALYPDPLLSNILEAATYPDDVRQAAAWLRANPQLTGEQAVRAAEPTLWPPSVKALLAFPDLLARMDESPQWTADLGGAFLIQEPQVMETVQGLRHRAQASGALQSTDQYSVQQQGQAIVVYPVQPQVIYAPYYNPYVVYGPWWWPAYRPVFWRPWHPRPAVFVSTTFYSHRVDWTHRRIAPAAPRPAFLQNRVVPIHNHVQQRIQQVQPLRPVEARPRPRAEAPRPVSVFNHVQQAQFAQPIVQQHFQARQIHAPRALPPTPKAFPQQGGAQRQAHQHRGGR
jgi:uncharacterized protein DUF3300